MRKWAEGKVAERNLKGNFLFLGRRPVEMMPRYYSLADTLLVTLKNEEIFKFTIPSKVQSYLACAKPIIASLSGESGKIIKESKAGYSCSPEDPPALAELVLKMYHMDKRQREIMGLNGRKYFEENFCRERIVNESDLLLRGIKGAEA